MKQGYRELANKRALRAKRRKAKNPNKKLATGEYTTSPTSRNGAQTKALRPAFQARR